MAEEARVESPMKILLVGNYKFDGSTSMKIWGNTLHRELLQRGIDVRFISPKPLFGRIKPSAVGFGKWLGYIDRFLLFPRQLRVAAAKVDIIHLCDHGSAMFAFTIKKRPVLVTCHDMLAVRGALGEVPDCPASFFGRFLQLQIRRGLLRASQVACVSHYTLNDAKRILKEAGNLCVVLNGLNYPFRPLEPHEVDRRLSSLNGIEHPFILHVGSNEPRKNREGVLRVFAKAAKSTDLQLVFAGEALSRDLLRSAHELQIYDRIVQVVKPEVEIIEALYNRAVALLFPSRYEGFGWPSIEAQACGCPVVGSHIPPLVEVLGQSAVLEPIENESGMAESIVRLATDDEYRENMRQRGFANVKSRFQISRMMDEYMSLYRELVPQG
jgi:glycosyltransferase involved in cell wall biosynthesis